MQPPFLDRKGIINISVGFCCYIFWGVQAKFLQPPSPPSAQNKTSLSWRVGSRTPPCWLSSEKQLVSSAEDRSLDAGWLPSCCAPVPSLLVTVWSPIEPSTDQNIWWSYYGAVCKVGTFKFHGLLQLLLITFLTEMPGFKNPPFWYKPKVLSSPDEILLLYY